MSLLSANQEIGSIEIFEGNVKIKTPFTIIGIKGTTFIVNATKDSSVTLKEGLYRQKVKAEFESYISTQSLFCWKACK